MSSSLLPRGLRVNVASANGDASAASPSPSDNGTELHVRRLRGFVLEALRRAPRLRVVELTPDGRRCAVSVAGVGLVHLEIRPPENRRTCPLTPRAGRRRSRHALARGRARGTRGRARAT